MQHYISETEKTKKECKETHTTKHDATKNYPELTASYDTRPGNEVGLFYQSWAMRKTPANIKLHLYQGCASDVNYVNNINNNNNNNNNRSEFLTWPK